MSHAYFAYGSNLDPVQMKRRCPSSQVVGRATLSDHRLVFPVRSDGDWAGGVAGVEPTAGQTVHGVVYTVDDADLAALDRYEAVDEGMYRRARVGVEVEGVGPQEVWTYYAIPDPAGPTPPSKKYRDAILGGATHHGLPAEYLQQLAAIQTLD